jgi:hypothetical protein
VKFPQQKQRVLTEVLDTVKEDRNASKRSSSDTSSSSSSEEEVSDNDHLSSSSSSNSESVSDEDLMKVLRLWMNSRQYVWEEPMRGFARGSEYWEWDGSFDNEHDRLVLHPAKEQTKIAWDMDIYTEFRDKKSYDGSVLFACYDRL